MARHLGTVTEDEWDRLHEAVVSWLKQHGVAGSIAADYSLYRALDDERDKAISAVRLGAEEEADEEEGESI